VAGIDLSNALVFLNHDYPLDQSGRLSSTSFHSSHARYRFYDPSTRSQAASNNPLLAIPPIAKANVSHKQSRWYRNAMRAKRPVLLMLSNSNAAFWPGQSLLLAADGRGSRECPTPTRH
jgi:hypothetical protein